MITRVVTSSEMREIDRISIEEMGIPSAVLMNNAGRAVADFIAGKFPGRKITIFCGTGNNGGDGFTAAYYLFNMGFSPVIYLSGKADRVSETSAVYLGLCRNTGIEIHETDEKSLSSVSVPQGSIAVDAVLGTGFEGSAKGIPLEFIRIMNKSLVPVVSVDIPSGLPSDGKMSGGESVRADYTITIGLPKISLVTWPCREF
jgi:NAD(P)H-hydrate epimerase